MIIHAAKTSLHNEIAVPGSYEVTFGNSPSVHVLTANVDISNKHQYVHDTAAKWRQAASTNVPTFDASRSPSFPASGEMSTSMNPSARLRTPKCSSQCSSFFPLYDISKVCFTFKPNSTFSGSTLKDVYLYTDPRNGCVNIKHDYWFTGGLAGALTRISNAI